jgi:hypothetical protein
MSHQPSLVQVEDETEDIPPAEEDEDNAPVASGSDGSGGDSVKNPLVTDMGACEVSTN